MTPNAVVPQRLAAVVLCLLCFAAPMISRAASQPTPTSLPDSDAIKALEQQVEAAFKSANAGFLNATLGDDFRFTHATGTVAGKAETVANFAKPGNFVSRTLTSVEVEVHGSVAVTNGRIEVRTAAPREYTVCYTRLYERRGDQWRLLSHRTFREAAGFAETCAPR